MKWAIGDKARIVSRNMWSNEDGAQWEETIFIATITELAGRMAAWEYDSTISVENPAPWYQVPTGGGFNVDLTERRGTITKISDKQFACVWGYGYEPATSVESIEFFDEGVGYSAEDRAKINELDEGEQWKADDMAFHIVIRVG